MFACVWYVVSILRTHIYQANIITKDIQIKLDLNWGAARGLKYTAGKAKTLFKNLKGFN